eukprot:scaffold33574_cov152-Skeletonema_marinoi.AAC.3
MAAGAGGPLVLLHPLTSQGQGRCTAEKRNPIPESFQTRQQVKITVSVSVDIDNSLCRRELTMKMCATRMHSQQCVFVIFSKCRMT